MVRIVLDSTSAHPSPCQQSPTRRTALERARFGSRSSPLARLACSSPWSIHGRSCSRLDRAKLHDWLHQSKSRQPRARELSWPPSWRLWQLARLGELQRYNTVTIELTL